MELPIRTERLVLRELTMDDLDDHARMYADPSVVRHLYSEVLDREGATEHLTARLVGGLPPEGEWRNLAVESDGRFLGEAGVKLVSAEHLRCEIGYVFLPEAGGHGFATEAAGAMVQLAFTEMNAHRVEARLDARNTSSARLLERLGMRLEGHLRETEFVKGEWTDELVYGITRDEWDALRSR